MNRLSVPRVHPISAGLYLHPTLQPSLSDLAVQLRVGPLVLDWTETAMDRTRYVRLGAVLTVAGACILSVSLLVLKSHQGLSTGIALLVLGLVILLLGRTSRGVSPELAALLVKVGYDNMGRLFEEVGLESRAVYLPSAMAHGQARAFLPLVSGPYNLSSSSRLDDRLVVMYGDGADDVGLMVCAPGTAALPLLESPPGATMDEISVALTQVVVATLKLARSVDAHEHDGRIEVGFRNGEAAVVDLPSMVEFYLGSVQGSVAAGIVAEARGQRVTIESEVSHRSGRTVVLVLHPD